MSSGRLGQDINKSKERLDKFSSTQKIRPRSSYDYSARPGTAIHTTTASSGTFNIPSAQSATTGPVGKLTPTVP